jgi:P4 family phage/plasmid primase-like protien
MRIEGAVNETDWSNYFVTTTRAFGSDGHLPAAQLRSKIASWSGGEAYHCAYDLEPRENFNDYVGLMRPALGYVWFDFDSKDGGVQALADTRAFVTWLNLPDLFICYSGSKGFHVGVPFGYFGLEPSLDLSEKLNALAWHLKSTTYPTLDTTIYNANRKFRALGSKHPKTGLYKIQLENGALHLPLDHIQQLARKRGNLVIPIPDLRSPLKRIVELFHVEQVIGGPSKGDSKPGKPDAPKKDWKAPSGQAAFGACSFLQHARDHQEVLSEPEWYAALSIVSRFQDGRKQCHQISYKHKGYSVSETNSKIDQALAESAPRTCESIFKIHEGCARCPLWGKINSPVNVMDRRFWDINDRGGLIPQYNELLNEFIKQNPYKTIADIKAVYIFKETHYVEYTPIEIRAFAEEHFQPKPKQKERQEFEHKVFANSIEKRSFFQDTTAHRINFRNGVLDLTGDQIYSNKNLENHSPRFGFRHVLPYDYDPSALCPTFDWWIRDVMCGDEELVKILQEFMGYVIRGGEYKYHKALWLAGTGRNGKSTFLDLLKALIGDGNYSALSIKAISQDKFSSASLDGMIANFSEETSPEELSDSSQFKNLTGDGDVNAQKKYGDPYKFRNRAKLIMTYNEVPELRDLSPGMMSRPIIVPWEKDLSADELQDKGLKEKLLKELPGIFNFALKGWQRLEEQSGFTYSAKSELAKQTVREASCTALQWVENYVTMLPINPNSANREVRTPQELYEHYKDVEGRFAYKAVKFFRRINENQNIKKRRRMTKNSSEYFAMLLKQRASFSAHKSDLPDSPQLTRDVPPTEY